MQSSHLVHSAPQVAPSTLQRNASDCRREPFRVGVKRKVNLGPCAAASRLQIKLDFDEDHGYRVKDRPLLSVHRQGDMTTKV